MCNGPKMQSKSSTLFHSRPGWVVNVLLFIMQKVWRAASCSTVSYSASSQACDPCMFSPEKISPDSLLGGKYMQDGMFVFFICSLSLHRLFLHPSLPPPPLWFYDESFSSLHFSVWSPPPIYICVPFSDFLFCSSFYLFSTSLLFLSCHNLSAPYPVVEESRLGPSSVSGKVALQLAACPTRGPSLPGLVTHNSVLLRPQPQRKVLVGSGLLGWLLKVNLENFIYDWNHSSFTARLTLLVFSKLFSPFDHANTITTLESQD